MRQPDNYPPEEIVFRLPCSPPRRPIVATNPVIDGLLGFRARRIFPGRNSRRHRIFTILVLVSLVFLLQRHRAYAADDRSGPVQAELSTETQALSGGTGLTIRTLGLSVDVSPSASLTVALPFSGGKTGQALRPALGMTWSIPVRGTQSFTLSPQYDLGNPLRTARLGLLNGTPSLTLPIEATWGDEDKGGQLSASVGVVVPRSSPATGLYRLGFDRQVGKNRTLGTAIEGFNGLTLAHLSGTFGIANGLDLELDYGRQIARNKTNTLRSISTIGFLFRI